MRLLDLFCGAGGAAMGYHRAGFEVVGVDIVPQTNYPFTFVHANAMDVLDRMTGTPPEDYDARVPGLFRFHVIHASPPCQAYTSLTKDRGSHPDLYGRVRERLMEVGLPWVIENVIGAPYDQGVVLCGSMFGLRVRRHRNFETSFLILDAPPCRHDEQGRPITVTGTGDGTFMHSDKGVKAEWPAHMGMEWATPEECTQAIPPAYTEWIGKRIMEVE